MLAHPCTPFAYACTTRVQKARTQLLLHYYDIIIYINYIHAYIILKQLLLYASRARVHQNDSRAYCSERGLQHVIIIIIIITFMFCDLHSLDMLLLCARVCLTKTVLLLFFDDRLKIVFRLSHTTTRARACVPFLQRSFINGAVAANRLLFLIMF